MPKRQACLFVNGLTRPFAYMRCTANLRQYDGKIIECSFRDHEWHFHRERTDKSFPNAKGKLNSIIYYLISVFFLVLETAFGKWRIHSYFYLSIHF